MLFVVRPPGLQYEGETREQAADKDRQIAEHNVAVANEMEKWRGPARFYRTWLEKHAPHLIPPYWR